MCCIVVLVLGSFYILIRAINADNMRMRLCASSAACGFIAIASLVFIANMPATAVSEKITILKLGGTFSFGFGTAGFILSIVSFFYGRRTMTGSPVFSILGFVSSLIAIWGGFFSVLAGSGVIHYLRGPQNIWRSDSYPIEVVLPTRESVPVPDLKVVAKYISDQPPFSASVIDIRVIENEEEFKKLLKHGQELKASQISTDSKEDIGTNRHGQWTWIYLCTAKRDGKSTVYGLSITRVNNLAVRLRFEGEFFAQFGPQQTEEIRILRQLGEEFLGSVRLSTR
jgi:hypothetical protein